MSTGAQSFTGHEGGATALLQLLESCKRQVRISSLCLTHAIYSEALTVQALSDFARRSRYSRVEILVSDTTAMYRRPHRLLPLIQRLGSHIQLRCLQDEHGPEVHEYVVGDDQQVLFVADPDLWRGTYELESRQRARKLNEAFSQRWAQAVEDPNLRQLQL
ncbi:hypothetical protein [Microbulbifer sp. SA54]|uniref:DUF7931 domain-containing protein n=1 Tax=Microbulbifer sp. SA54 TaxID=3401577 RepID=UPI003AB0A6D0